MQPRQVAAYVRTRTLDEVLLMVKERQGASSTRMKAQVRRAQGGGPVGSRRAHPGTVACATTAAAAAAYAPTAADPAACSCLLSCAESRQRDRHRCRRCCRRCTAAVALRATLDTGNATHHRQEDWKGAAKKRADVTSEADLRCAAFTDVDVRGVRRVVLAVCVHLWRLV